MSRFGELGGNLYRGEVSYDFVGRRKRWYAISAIILLISIGALLGRGLTLGIEFEGGAVFVVPTSQGTVAEAQDAATAGGAPGEVIVTELNGTSGRSLRVQTETLTAEQSQKVGQSLAKEFDVTTAEISVQLVGPSWGDEITKKALRGLIYFVILVVIFLAVYFEWQMAIAALVALAHDLIITVGLYALIGFTVTPATIIGVLTILGYSLYDTVVVFDKVKENTRGIAGSSKMTYSESANLALNQTLVRSINTSIIALLPVTAILVVAVGFLGAGTLKDLALALFVGIAAGTYSSIFIATPMLAQIKEHDPKMKALAKRVEARRSAAERTASGKAPLAAGGGGTATAVVNELDIDLDDVDEAPAAPQPPRPGSTSSGNRNQPRRKGAGNRPGGKKRR
jgi:preprotein translocase subunit SecF